MSRLELSLLGPFAAALDGKAVTGFVSDKARALLSYLMVEVDRAHRRETLAGLLWPDYPERSARTNLSNTLSNLRTVLDDRDSTSPFLLISRETIQFNARSDHRLDATACDTLVDGERWEEAIALYRGGFLEGFSLPDSAPFEGWALNVGERLQRQMMAALEGLAAECEGRGDYVGAQDAARRQLELEPWHEGAHRALMRCMALDGERSTALAQYEQCRRVLEEELGAEPSPQTKRLAEQIRDGQLAGLVAKEAQPQLNERQYNLPAQLTPFVGREGELARVRDCLEHPDCRLLTLVGPGGSGKTRLALPAAEAQLGRFTDGVYFAPLASLGSTETIIPAIARALGFSFYGAAGSGAAVTPRQQLLDYLREKRMLLVLDNVEHLLSEQVLDDRSAAANIIADILKTAPAVKVLATSRVRLNIQGEHRFHIVGLDFPDRDSLQDAFEYSAVKLFMQAARRAQPTLELRDDELEYVARICRLVDGMPLGILLAAAWIEMLTPEEIAAEISQSLDILETDLHGVPERQRSMRAVFDHSWSLLPEGQQAILQALSVFRGGFTRAAAQEVTGASLRELMSLVNRSLLHRSPTGRYEIHELLRQYAMEKLDQSPGVGEAARDNHGAYYASALTRWAADLKGARQQATLAEMESEIENERAAWDWALAQGRMERLDQAMVGLGLFYEWRARHVEGEAAFRAVAEREPSASWLSERVRIKALTWQALFCRHLGRTESARRLLQQSLDLLEGFELAGQEVGLEKAFVLQEMGWIEYWSGNNEQAKQFAVQSLSLYRALGDHWATALTLWILGQATWSLGEYDEARRSHQEGLDIRRVLGDQRGIAWSLREMGLVLANQGQFQEAERLLQESLTTSRELGNATDYIMGRFRLAAMLLWRGEFTEVLRILEEYLAATACLGAPLQVAFGDSMLGVVKAHLGHRQEARAHLQRGLAVARDADHRWGSGMALQYLGHVALANQEYSAAQRWLRDSFTILQESGFRQDVGSPLSLLAGALLGLGRLPEARRHLYAALQMSADIQDVRTPTHALPVAALLLADMGEAERAVDIYALALRYGFVANSCLWEAIAGRHVATLAATLPPDLVAAAQRRGQARDLWSTIGELLAELET